MDIRVEDEYRELDIEVLESTSSDNSGLHCFSEGRSFCSDITHTSTIIYSDAFEEEKLRFEINLMIPSEYL